MVAVLYVINRLKNTWGRESCRILAQCYSQPVVVTNLGILLEFSGINF